MQWLLQVVKWFTKCLFYGWLLKICIGLSLLLSSFCSWHVLQMFQLPSLRTAAVTTCIKHCKQWKLLVPGGKNRCTHDKVWLHFFSLQISTSISSLIIWQMSVNVSLLQGNIQWETATFIQPDVSLQEHRRAGSDELSLLSCLCHVALSPHVKWLLFLHEHFSSSHRNKKP